VHPNMRLIWVDAHGDINTPKTSPSGNLHGMPLAALLGLFELKKRPGFDWFKPCLTPDQVVYLGVRDLDPEEEKNLSQLEIPAYSSLAINFRGMHEIITEIFEDMEIDHSTPVYISVDVDALDPTVAPATGLPVHNGITVENLVDLTRFCRLGSKLIGADFAEFNPFVVGSTAEVRKTLSVSEQFFIELFNIHPH